MGTQIETNMMRAARVRSWFPTLLWIRLGRLGWLTYFHGYWDYEMVEVQVPVASRHPVQQEIRINQIGGLDRFQISSRFIKWILSSRWAKQMALSHDHPNISHGYPWFAKSHLFWDTRGWSWLIMADPRSEDSEGPASFINFDSVTYHARGWEAISIWWVWRFWKQGYGFTDQVIGMEFTLINGEH